jgi:hypothetical protein
MKGNTASQKTASPSTIRLPNAVIQMKNLTNFQFKTRTKQYLGSSPVVSRSQKKPKSLFSEKDVPERQRKRNMMSLLQLR